MPIYQIADLNIKIKPVFQSTKSKLEPYLTASQGFDFEISVSEAEIAEYKASCKEFCTDEGAESVLILTALCNKVLESYDGMFFHSSSLMLDNEAYVFTAPSGTGKSTHTALWRKHFGSRVTMINDDKPIIRKLDGRFYICGTPWMGKSDIGNNVKAPIKAVYIIERSTDNFAKKISVGQYFNQVLEATLIPTDRENMSKLLDLLDGLFSDVPLYLLKCNKEIDAVKAAYEAVNKNSKDSK